MRCAPFLPELWPNQIVSHHPGMPGGWQLIAWGSAIGSLVTRQLLLLIRLPLQPFRWVVKSHQAWQFSVRDLQQVLGAAECAAHPTK